MIKMKKEFVYLTGLVEGSNRQVTLYHRSNLAVIKHRILALGFISTCPVLWYSSCLNDPRFPGDNRWWVDNVFRQFMEMSSYFVYIPLPKHGSNERMKLEKDLWQTVGTGEFISADDVIRRLNAR